MKSKSVWLSCILAALVCVRPANASVIMTLEQDGPNVVATAEGTVDITDLTFLAVTGFSPFIEASRGNLFLGASDSADIYGGVSGPADFGNGGPSSATSGGGDQIAIFAPGPTGPQLDVPDNYVSGMPLSGTATWNNTTIDELGVNPGIYTWTWGSGDHADSLTLFAGVPVSTPEPTTWSLLGISFAAIGVVYRRRNRIGRHMDR